MAVVNTPEVRRLRALVEVEGDASIPQDAAQVSVGLSDGTWHRRVIDHCVGSLAYPMSDEALESKFLGQVTGVLGAVRAAALLRACWDLALLEDAGEVARRAG